MAFSVFRRLLNLKHVANRNFSTTSVARSGDTWYYRSGEFKHPKRVIVMAEAMGGFAWWWILWHCYSEPEHILGEFDYPDPSKWTNEELGIPPDDYD